MPLTLPPAQVLVVGQSGVISSHTGDTNPFTYATVTVPAGAMGLNSRLRITCLWSYPNSANTKTLQIKFGTLTCLSQTPTTTVARRDQVEISNRNSLSSQICNSNGLWSSTTTSAVITGAINTAVAQDITFIGTLALGSETLNLETYLVELFP